MRHFRPCVARYLDWRLEILTSNADAGIAVRALIEEAADDLAARIDVIDPSDQSAFNELVGNPAESTTLRLVGLLLPGDQLGCDALLEIALASGLHRDADLIYGDEVRISPASREREPFFKPDFSPDLLLSTNYIGRPWFASTALLGRCGVTVRSLLETGEYDAVLRCTEHAALIHHVPKLLCLRGTQQIDDAQTEAAALARAVTRRGIAADVLAGAVAGMACQAARAGDGHGVDHHPDMCGARLCRELHQDIARAHGVSQLRDRLRRQHSGRSGRMEDLAAAECR